MNILLYIVLLTWAAYLLSIVVGKISAVGLDRARKDCFSITIVLLGIEAMLWLIK